MKFHVNIVSLTTLSFYYHDSCAYTNVCDSRTSKVLVCFPTQVSYFWHTAQNQ